MDKKKLIIFTAILFTLLTSISWTYFTGTSNLERNKFSSYKQNFKNSSSHRSAVFNSTPLNIATSQNENICFDLSKLNYNPEPQVILGLEEEIKENPENIDARVKLLAAYFSKFDDIEIRKKRAAHIIWMIKNAPRNDILRTHLSILNKETDPSYNEAIDLWEGHMVRNPSDHTILEAAAKFTQYEREDIAWASFSKLEELDPNNPEWPKSLASIAFNSSFKGDIGKFQQIDAIAKIEKALSLVTKGDDSWNYTLRQAIRISAASGDVDRSKGFANELISSIKTPATMDSHHFGHQALGNIAFDEGDISLAINELFKSTDDINSTQLLPWQYPETVLAKKLLGNGNQTEVLKYLKICKKIWISKHNLINSWINDVIQTGDSDFIIVHNN